MDFEMNYKFAKKLESVSKKLTQLSNHVSQVAADITDKVDAAQDRKDIKQGIILVGDVTDPKDKCEEAKTNSRTKFVTDFRIKTEHCESTTDEDDIVEIYSGEPDGHFTYPKTNEHPAETHTFICQICTSVFRDQNELRNHDSSHKMKFYQCMLCYKYLRSLRSFENHRASHQSDHTCKECGKSFALKTSLYNHAQIHSTDRMKCTYPGCPRMFKHRQNFLEHVNFGHRTTKDVKCTICKKMFQTPTSMRAHRVHTHGDAPKLIPGHPLKGLKPLKEKKKKKK